MTDNQKDWLLMTDSKVLGVMKDKLLEEHKKRKNLDGDFYNKKILKKIEFLFIL